MKVTSSLFIMIIRYDYSHNRDQVCVKLALRFSANADMPETTMSEVCGDKVGMFSPSFWSFVANKLWNRRRSSLRPSDNGRSRAGTHGQQANGERVDTYKH
jgi:hypothetical protein